MCLWLFCFVFYSIDCLICHGLLTDLVGKSARSLYNMITASGNKNYYKKDICKKKKRMAIDAELTYEHTVQTSMNPHTEPCFTPSFCRHQECPGLTSSGIMIINNNNNVHLSCAHQRPERSHDTY